MELWSVQLFSMMVHLCTTIHRSQIHLKHGSMNKVHRRQLVITMKLLNISFLYIFLDDLIRPRLWIRRLHVCPSMIKRFHPITSREPLPTIATYLFCSLYHISFSFSFYKIPHPLVFVSNKQFYFE